MLSRLVFNTTKAWMSSKPLLANQLVRPMSSITRYPVNINPPNLPEIKDTTDGIAEPFDPKTQSLEEFLNIRFGPEMPTIHDEKRPERDVKNYPRVTQRVWPDRTRLFLIPDSWFEYFYEKTGVTGPYVFGASFITFLLSKEIYVIEHEFFTGVSLAILTAVVCVKFGPAIRNWYCEQQEAETAIWEEWQKGMENFLGDMVNSELDSQELAKQQKILFDAKRENIKLQLEAEFRRRQMVAYSEVRNRLEYMLAKQVAERQYQQQHMVNWIIDGVRKGITAQQEKDVLQKCLIDLKQLSTKHKISLT